MKKARPKFNDVYAETLRRTRLSSQAFSFVAALVLIFRCGESIWRIVAFDGTISEALRRSLAIELGPTLFVAALFAARFGLLFGRGTTAFRLSQLVWLATQITLWSMINASGGCTKNAFPLFGENLSYIFVFYLFLSPFRQLFILLAAAGGLSSRPTSKNGGCD